MKNSLNTLLQCMLIGFILSSCTQKTNSEENEESTYQSYGTSISEEGTSSIKEVNNLLASKDSMNLKLKGKILKTCAAKGCWMEIEKGDGETMRVTFKDYGFFVPKSGMEGKTVILQGTAFNSTTSVEDLKHFAQDGGASEGEIAKITEPKNEVSFVAEGVLIEG